jgi:hypothetical protein
LFVIKTSMASFWSRANHRIFDEAAGMLTGCSF